MYLYVRRHVGLYVYEYDCFMYAHMCHMLLYVLFVQRCEGTVSVELLYTNYIIVVVVVVVVVVTFVVVVVNPLHNPQPGGYGCIL